MEQASAPGAAAAKSSADEPLVAQWRLGRNCAMAPRAYFGHMAAATLLLLLFGLGFAAIGAPLVAVFCAAQTVAVLAGGAYFAVHAADGQQVLLYPGRLVVRTFDGLQQREQAFNPFWVRLQRGRGRQQDEYWLCCHDVRLPLGRHVTPARRRQVVVDMASCLLRCHDAVARQGES